jgi:hypothetical protein
VTCDRTASIAVSAAAITLATWSFPCNPA